MLAKHLLIALLSIACVVAAAPHPHSPRGHHAGGQENGYGVLVPQPVKKSEPFPYTDYNILAAHAGAGLSDPVVAPELPKAMKASFNPKTGRAVFEIGSGGGRAGVTKPFYFVPRSIKDSRVRTQHGLVEISPFITQSIGEFQYGDDGLVGTWNGWGGWIVCPPLKQNYPPQLLWKAKGTTAPDCTDTQLFYKCVVDGAKQQADPSCYHWQDE